MKGCLRQNEQTSPWVLGALLMVGTTLGWYAPVRAESIVIPDNTLGAESSFVNDLDALTQIVEGGASREGNLFHSFLEFNVAEDHGVYFANPADIESILTRVTGDNSSNIFGRLGVLGEANLFLLNPNGIVFGENASLDINGSFYASTAESISLGEGVFSATVPESSQLLTIDPEVTFLRYLTPGLGEINNSGDLSIGAGKTLTLLGDTVLSSGALTASGGTVQVLGNLVGLIDQATVDVSGATGGGTVLVGGDYQGQAPVPAAERTFVGSEVVIAADALAVGDGGRVIVWADGTTQFLGRISAQGGPQGGNGGFVEVSGLEFLDFAGDVNTQTVDGEAGQLLLDPANIVIADVAPVGFVSVGQGDGVFDDFLYGEAEDAVQDSHLTPDTVEALLDLNDLTLEATDVIAVIDDVNAFSENTLTLRAAAIGIFDARLGQSGGGDIVLETPQVEGSFVLVSRGLVDTNVLFNASTKIGDVSITTHDLVVESDSVLSASTFGDGNSGKVEITATGDITIDGERSLIASQVNSGAVGDSGGISIMTNNLSVLNSGAVSADTFGEGDSGQVEIITTGDIIVDGERSLIASTVESDAVGDSGGISIMTNNLSVLNSGAVSANTFSEGNAGQVEITAMGDITVDGEFAFIASQVNSGAVGNSGGVSITTNNLSILNIAAVSAGTFSEGNAGQVEITAMGDIIVDGERSFIASTVDSNAVGDSGGISIMTNNLSVLNSGAVSADTFGEGNSGQVEITVTGNIIVDGEDSFITSTVESDAVGDSGGISIMTNNLSVLNSGAVSANTFSEGNAGQVEITAMGDITVDGEFAFIASQVNSGAVGNSGGVSITTNNLSILNIAAVSAGTFSEGNAGQVEITAMGDIIVDGERSFIASTVDSNAVGDSGGISIMTNNLSVLNSGAVSADTFGEGNSGQVEITVTGNIIVDGEDSFITSTVESDAVGDSGGISIMTNNLSMFDGASVTTATRGNGMAGLLRLQSNFDSDLNIKLSENSSIRTLTSSPESGGDLIIISDGSLIIQGPGELTTESLGANTGTAGNLNIFADSVLLDDGVELSTQTASAEGGGNINFFVDGSIILRRGSFINAESTNETPGSGSGGNITLNAGAVVVIPAENSDIIANAMGGDGGNIRINAAGIFGFTEQSDFRTTDELRANGSSDISASSQSGQQGTINLNADFEQTQALDELPDNFISADQLVSSSCIARSDDAEGAFVVAGNGGLPQQPDSTTSPGYSTGTIQTVPEATASQSFQEPAAVYQLADGRLVMSQECRGRMLLID